MQYIEFDIHVNKVTEFLNKLDDVFRRFRMDESSDDCYTIATVLPPLPHGYICKVIIGCRFDKMNDEQLKEKMGD